jgi:hypothetical protein
MNESKPPSFWTTLPGILAGTASLLTALVAVFSLLDHREKAAQQNEVTQAVPAPQTTQESQAPPLVETAPATHHTGAVEPAPAPVVELKNLEDCGAFVGKWNWFIGGELRAEKDGSVDWRQRPEDPQPVIVGRWVCLDTRPQQVNISWANGISETLSFSPDHKSLSGKNTIGVQVSGSKKALLH